MKVEVADTFVAALAMLKTGVLNSEALDADVLKLSQFFLRFSLHLLADSINDIVRLVK